MPELVKTSQAQILRSLVRAIEYQNPEQILPNLLKEYFLEIGFDSMYPNFRGIRIGAVHPFALLLFQSVIGQSLDMNVFPSITVSDTSDTEIDDDLAKGAEDVVFGEDEVAHLLGYADSGQIIISDTGRTSLQNATVGGGQVVGRKYDNRANHNVDLNIWGDNKDIVSLIYDLVRHYIVGNTAALHRIGLDVHSALTGRRSGDINVEFGTILYGANLTVPMVIHTANIIFDLGYEVIEEVDTKTLPAYHEPV